MGVGKRPIRITVVEDNIGDIGLLREVFTEKGIPYHFNVVEDGEKALQYFEWLQHESERPDCIILDLNLPFVSGLELLEKLKSFHGLHGIPIAVFTGSQRLSDRTSAVFAGVSDFWAKPNSLDGIDVLSRSVIRFLRTHQILSDVNAMGDMRSDRWETFR
jgi:two-component system, chemotaxis family, response regulator Rcp1